MRLLALFVALTLSPDLPAGTAFFVTAPVQAPAASSGQDAMAAQHAGATLVRQQIPGERAYQMAGPDGPAIGRIYTKPATGSYLLTDAGSQWTTTVTQGQALLGVLETRPGQFGWTGKAFVGASQGAISKFDVAMGRLSLAPILLSEIPAPQLAAADEDRIQLDLPGFVDSSGIASGLVLWRQEQGQAWEKRSDLSIQSSGQAFLDLSVTALAHYRYGLSVRYPWPGGGQGGALPLEMGSYVSLAQSDSGLIQASKVQPSPTPFPTLPAAPPTPDLGSEAWLAYPNPNRDGWVRLAFRMVKKGSYNVKFYSLDGALIRQMDGKAEAGAWPLPVADLTKMASGIYLVRLQIDYEGETRTQLPLRKLALVR